MLREHEMGMNRFADSAQTDRSGLGRVPGVSAAIGSDRGEQRGAEWKSHSWFWLRRRIQVQTDSPSETAWEAEIETRDEKRLGRDSDGEVAVAKWGKGVVLQHQGRRFDPRTPH